MPPSRTTSPVKLGIRRRCTDENVLHDVPGMTGSHKLAKRPADHHGRRQHDVSQGSRRTAQGRLITALSPQSGPPCRCEPAWCVGSPRLPHSRAEWTTDQAMLTWRQTASSRREIAREYYRCGIGDTSWRSLRLVRGLKQELVHDA